MVATLLRLVGIDLKRLARETATTLVFAMLGAFALVVTATIGFVALYLWLQLKLGTFGALGILGGACAMLAIICFFIAFRRAPRKPVVRAEDAMRAATDPVQSSAAAIGRAADEAVSGAADFVRKGSVQQIAGTIAVAALIGWVLGRKF